MTRAATAATPEAAEHLSAAETPLQPGDGLTFDATQTVHTLHNPAGRRRSWQAQLHTDGQPPTTFSGMPTP